MFKHLHWLFRKLSRRLWVRATAFWVLDTVTTLIVVLVQDYIFTELPATIDSDAAGSKLLPHAQSKQPRPELTGSVDGVVSKT